jgi:hypothetical protein
MHIDLLLASALRQFDCPAKFSQFTILQQAQGVCVQEINATDGFILDEFFFLHSSQHVERRWRSRNDEMIPVAVGSP